MKRGFTLAEVLITLGIIGVVAALTIPTLINNYQKKEYVTQLKKSYSQFTEALKLMSADMYCTNDLACTGLFNYDTDEDRNNFGNEIVKYIKTVKNCTNLNGEGCMSNLVSSNIDGSGDRDTLDESGAFQFIATDGSSYRIDSVMAGNCKNDQSGGIENSKLTEVCATLTIDVNGPQKKPNNFGRDIFIFWITNKAILYPYGGKDDLSPWKDRTTGDILSCSSDIVDGNSCAGRIIEEGWQMNY